MILAFNFGSPGAPTTLHVTSLATDSRRLRGDAVRTIKGSLYYTMTVQQAYPAPSPYQEVMLEVVLTQEDLRSLLHSWKIPADRLPNRPPYPEQVSDVVERVI